MVADLLGDRPDTAALLMAVGGDEHPGWRRVEGDLGRESRSRFGSQTGSGLSSPGLNEVQDGPMSNDSAPAIRQERRDWMARHRDTYLQSGGTQGHVMDITAVGGHAFTTHS